MNKLVSPGFVDVGAHRPARLFLEIKYEEGRLSITGVEGPKSNGDAMGSCGQCVESLREVVTFSDGWDAGMCELLANMWDRWHLNDMTAGSPAQEDWLRAHPVTAVYPESHYVKACDALAAAGLNPDPSHDGYRYGSAWLREEIPADVLAWLEELPETTVAYPWQRSA